MSKQQVHEVLGRAVADSEFRNLLMSNPDEALAGYQLDPEEKAALVNFDSEKMSALATSLDERLTKGFNNMG